MRPATERARMIGGPRSLAWGVVPLGLAEFGITRTVIAAGTACGFNVPPCVTRGVYQRIPLVSPPVFLWQGWKP